MQKSPEKNRYRIKYHKSIYIKLSYYYIKAKTLCVCVCVCLFLIDSKTTERICLKFGMNTPIPCESNMG